MTEVLHPGRTDASASPELITDAELIALVRAGDSAAYEELFVRHRDVAIRYARRISGSERAEDLCAEAFTKILDLLQRGKGPDVAFRAYLLTTVRTSHLNNLRSGSREELVPDHEPISRMTPVVEDPDGRFDRGAIARAFAQLPERWQTALWLTAVEGRDHDEVSDYLGISSNAVASLTFRARGGLRQAYLAEHLLATTDPQCKATIELLPSYLRDRMSSRRRLQIEKHLAGCAACTAAALEVNEVDNRLGALLPPLALAGLAAGGSAHLGGLAGTISGFASTVVGNLKAGIAGAGILGGKTAVATGVAALSIAVGVEVVHQLEADQGLRAVPESVEQVAVPSRLAPAAPAVLAPTLLPTATPAPQQPASVAGPVRGTQPSEEPGAVEAPFDPATSFPEGSTTSSPAATPSATPTPSSPATTPPPIAARSVAVGPATNEQYRDQGAVWQRVALPVANAPRGTSLVVTATRSTDAQRAVTAGTGWVCGVPTTNWLNGELFATTTIRCSLSGESTGQALGFAFRVGSKGRFTAEVVPPAGQPDPDLSDNLLNILLRD